MAVLQPGCLALRGAAAAHLTAQPTAAVRRWLAASIEMQIHSMLYLYAYETRGCNYQFAYRTEGPSAFRACCVSGGSHSLGLRCIWHRFSDNAMHFDGLSTLTQLTRFATEYASTKQRQKLCSELAQLTRLRELDAPMFLQSEGERLGLPICAVRTMRVGCDTASTISDSKM